MFSQDPVADYDMWFMNLAIMSSVLPIYADCEGWNQSAKYELRLPASGKTVDVIRGMPSTWRKGFVINGLCTVCLRLVDEMVQAARAGAVHTALYLGAADGK